MRLLYIDMECGLTKACLCQVYSKCRRMIGNILFVKGRIVLCEEDVGRNYASMFKARAFATACVRLRASSLM